MCNISHESVKSKRFGDLKKLRIELEKRIQDQKDQSG